MMDTIFDVIDMFMGSALSELPAQSAVYVYTTCAIFLFTLVFSAGFSALFGCVCAMTGLRKGGKQ